MVGFEDGIEPVRGGSVSSGDAGVADEGVDWPVHPDTFVGECSDGCHGGQIQWQRRHASVARHLTYVPLCIGALFRVSAGEDHCGLRGHRCEFSGGLEAEAGVRTGDDRDSGEGGGVAGAHPAMFFRLNNRADPTRPPRAPDKAGGMTW